MKKLSLKLQIVFVQFAFLSGVSPALASAPSQPLRVVIDPGHGGSDDGAINEKLREASLVLDVANHINKLLKEDSSQFEPLMTRTADEFVGLKERVRFAHKKDADLYVSIHANSATLQGTQGFEVYFANHFSTDAKSLKRAHFENQDSQSPDKETSNSTTQILKQLENQSLMRQSYLLSRHLVSEWDFKQYKSIKQAPFFVINQSKAPAILIELGFISNPREAKLLLNEESKIKMAEKIVVGLRRYKEALDKSQSMRLN